MAFKTLRPRLRASGRDGDVFLNMAGNMGRNMSRLSATTTTTTSTTITTSTGTSDVVGVLDGETW